MIYSYINLVELLRRNIEQSSQVGMYQIMPDLIDRSFMCAKLLTQDLKSSAIYACRKKDKLNHTRYAVAVIDHRYIFDAYESRITGKPHVYDMSNPTHHEDIKARFNDSLTWEYFSECLGRYIKPGKPYYPAYLTLSDRRKVDRDPAESPSRQMIFMMRR